MTVKIKKRIAKECTILWSVVKREQKQGNILHLLVEHRSSATTSEQKFFRGNLQL